MKCMYCEGEMKKSTVPFHIDRKGVHVSLDEIPAWVCSQCGESYFEETEVDSMQALVKAAEEPQRSGALLQNRKEVWNSSETCQSFAADFGPLECFLLTSRYGSSWVVFASTHGRSQRNLVCSS